MKGGSIFVVLLVGMAPILILALLLTGLGLGLVRWQPPMLWSAQFGTPGVGVHNRVTAISSDSTGFYAGGFVGYPFSVVNASPSNLFVSRHDLAGRQLWTQEFGDPLVSEIKAVVAANDGVFVAGALSGVGFIKKYDLNGNEVWTDRFVSSQSQVDDVSIGAAGIYVMGYNYFASNGSYRVDLRNYDLNGNSLWTTVLTSGSARLFAGSTGVYVAGSSGLFQRYDFDGTLAWTRQLDCPCIPTSISGDASGVYVSGQRIADVFVSKHDSNGNLLWTRQDLLPLATSPLNVRMSADASGVYLAIVLANGGSLIMKYDGNGGQAWSFRVQWDAYAVSVGAGGFFVGGNLPSNEGHEDAFIAKFDQSSSLIFFGLNPPFSFLLVTGLVGAASLSVWLRRWKRHRTGTASPTHYGSKTLPGDSTQPSHSSST